MVDTFCINRIPSAHHQADEEHGADRKRFPAWKTPFTLTVKGFSTPGISNRQRAIVQHWRKCSWGKRTILHCKSCVQVSTMYPASCVNHVPGLYRGPSNKRLQMSVTAVCSFYSVLSRHVSCFVGVLARRYGR